MPTSSPVRRRAPAIGFSLDPYGRGTVCQRSWSRPPSCVTPSAHTGYVREKTPGADRWQLSSTGHSASSDNQLQQQGPSRRRAGVSDRSVASSRGLKESQPRPEGLCGRWLVHAISGWWPSDPGLLRLCSPFSLNAFLTRQFVTADLADQPLWICGFTREGDVSGAHFSATATVCEAPNAERKQAGNRPCRPVREKFPHVGMRSKTHKRPLPRAS